MYIKDKFSYKNATYKLETNIFKNSNFQFKNKKKFFITYTGWSKGH